MDCTFCDIVAGDASAHEVHRDDGAVAFLDANPVVAGHTLVAPTTHRDGLPALTDAEVAALFRVARDVAAAQRAALSADGVNVFHSTGAVAGQDVHHAHAHVVPRYEDDDIHFAPSRTTLPDEEMAEVAASLRGTL